MYSLENKLALKEDRTPDYKTFGAIMLDSADERDGKSYLYSSFLMDGEQ